MPNRLEGWDYTSMAAYFVTVCTYDRLPVLSSIDDTAAATPTALGDVVLRCLHTNADAAGLRIDRAIVMPDHLHAILRAEEAGATMPLDEMVRRFKAAASREARRNAVLSTSRRLWQHGFFDRIIRSECEYVELAAYIDTNPLRWILALERNRPTSRTATK